MFGELTCLLTKENPIVSMTEAPSAIPTSGRNSHRGASFQLHLRAENKARKTLETYTEALDQRADNSTLYAPPPTLGATAHRPGYSEVSCSIH